MAFSSDPRDRSRSRSPAQEYQLQDLSQFAGASYDGRGFEPTVTGGSPGRTLSERGHRLLHGRPRGGYSPVNNQERIPLNSPPSRPQLRIINTDESTPMTAVSDEEDDLEEHTLTPEQARALQAQHVGLGIGLHEPPGELGFSALPVSRARNVSFGGDSFTSYDPSVMPEDLDSGLQVPHRDDDMARLTDVRNQQPPGTFDAARPSGQNHDRDKRRSGLLSAVWPASPIARLDDKLRPPDDLEAGRRRNTRNSRRPSLSPTTPLQRASSILVDASRRMVNLSNEPDSAESQTRRRSIHRYTNSSDAMEQSASKELHESGNGHLDGNTSQVKIDPAHEPIVPYGDGDWYLKPETNPFRGKSLGIFPPDSPLRAHLCDLLIHPFTEPLILILIMVQTVLLTIQTAPDAFTHDRDKVSDFKVIDIAILALFITYTFEIVVRVIVSGFVLNPVEYSTINRQIGWSQALRKWFRNLFTLPSEQVEFDPQTEVQDTVQQSIFAKMASAPKLGDRRREKRHRQRMRLAYRAFLRHSFTRLDFLAVISYWIAFVFAFTRVESNTRLYTFDMLSCLRILRLLSLTKGTTVCLRLIHPESLRPLISL